MDGRTFVQFGIVGAAGTVASAHLAQAASKSSSLAGKIAGGVYYTKDAPGRWSKKVGGHVPIIEKLARSDKSFPRTEPGNKQERKNPGGRKISPRGAFGRRERRLRPVVGATRPGWR